MLGTPHLLYGLTTTPSGHILPLPMLEGGPPFIAVFRSGWIQKHQHPKTRIEDRYLGVYFFFVGGNVLPVAKDYGSCSFTLLLPCWRNS